MLAKLYAPSPNPFLKVLEELDEDQPAQEDRPRQLKEPVRPTVSAEHEIAIHIERFPN